MARADLLIKLIEAGKTGDRELFKKVTESLIAEERSKQHNVLADQLDFIIKNYKANDKINGFPNEKISSFLYHIYPKTTMDDLVFSKEILDEIHEFIQEHYRIDLLRTYNLSPRNRVLLIGEPGTGKTSLTEALASSLSLPLYSIRYDGIIGSYLGETATRLRQTFDYIKTQNCILFLDEFDSIGKERGDIHETGEIKRVVSSLLLQIDELPEHVIIVAATNHPELLDKAVWRRFQVRLELAKPDVAEIAKWISIFESKTELKFDIDAKLITSRLLGLSFSEIEELFLNIRRKYILDQPNANLKNILSNVLKKKSFKLKHE